MTENDYINDFIDKHKDEFASIGCKMVQNYAMGPSSFKIFFDVAIIKENKLIAVFEIKMLQSIYMRQNFRRYNYVTRDALLYIVKYKNDERKYFCLDKDKLATTQWEDIINEIKNRAEAINAADENDETEPKSDKEEESTLEFYKKQTKHLDPEWCRKELEAYTEKEICRFSSLESLFSSIKYKTIRMNGLPGMNDSGEGLYAWNMVYDEIAENSVVKNRKRQLNNAFIVSYSTIKKKDDLDQWRIYGDEAKGVCCVYEIDEEKVKDRFFIHKVRYITKDHDSDDKLLKNFKKYINKNEGSLNYYDLSPVIFFYKPKSYEKEDEVRLLVDNKETPAYKTQAYKREWQLTNANKIPNPYIDVPIKDVPLKLVEVILGPSMSDVDTIQVQLEEMLEQNGFTDVKVTLSGIDSYRKPNN